MAGAITRDGDGKRAPLSSIGAFSMIWDNFSKFRKKNCASRAGRARTCCVYFSGYSLGEMFRFISLTKLGGRAGLIIHSAKFKSRVRS